jgi:hypothetical protein
LAVLLSFVLAPKLRQGLKVPRRSERSRAAAYRHHHVYQCRP